MTEEEIKRGKELRKRDKAEARAAEWEKIRGLGTGARLRYFWDYYKIVLVIIAAVILTVYILFTMVTGALTDTLLYTCLMNAWPLEAGDEQLQEDFIRSIGGIGRWEQVTFDASLSVDPDAEGISQQDVSNSMKLTALLQTSILDVCVAPADVTEYLQEQGTLLELDDLLGSDRMAELQEEGCLYFGPEPLYDQENGVLIPLEPETEPLIASEQEDRPEPVPAQERDQYVYAVRVDQAGVLERYDLYGDEEIWFSVVAGSERTEMAGKLLDFLLGQEVRA